MVASLAYWTVDSTVEKMVLIPVVRMAVHWAVRLVDVKDVMWDVWTDVLMGTIWADVTVDLKVVDLVDMKDVRWGVWMDELMVENSENATVETWGVWMDEQLDA